MTTPETDLWPECLWVPPETVEACHRFLQTALADCADRVARIRREAEARQHHRVTGPLAELQGHLEEAVTLTTRTGSHSPTGL